MSQKTTPEKPAAQSAALQAVLQHQEAVAQAEQALKRLQDLKTGHQDKIATAERLGLELEEMHRQMQDLMADIAAGEDKQAELDELKKRAGEASDSLGDTGFDVSDDVLSGLDRKIGLAQAALKDLQGKRTLLMRRMLHEQAEALGADYARAAVETISLYRRLLSLNRMIEDHSQGGFSSILARANLELPSFELDSVRPYAEYIFKGHIYHGPKPLADVMQHMQAESERLQALGVEMAPGAV